MEAKHPLIVFTDTSVRTILMDHVVEAITAEEVHPAIRTGSGSSREAQLPAQKVFIPLHHAVHNDREKLARTNHAATELKLTDPYLAVNIRNLHSESIGNPEPTVY